MEGCQICYDDGRWCDGVDGVVGLCVCALCLVDWFDNRASIFCQARCVFLTARFCVKNRRQSLRQWRVISKCATGLFPQPVISLFALLNQHHSLDQLQHFEPFKVFQKVVSNVRSIPLGEFIFLKTVFVVFVIFIKWCSETVFPCFKFEGADGIVCLLGEKFGDEGSFHCGFKGGQGQFGGEEQGNQGLGVVDGLEVLLFFEVVFLDPVNQDVSR